MDGKELTTETLPKQMPGAQITSNQLRIPRVKVAHSARFSCVAKNKAGQAEQDILLYVTSEFNYLILVLLNFNFRTT